MSSPDVSTGLRRRIEQLTPLRFTERTATCLYPRPYMPIPHPTVPYLSLTLPAWDDDSVAIEMQQQVECLSDPEVALKLSAPPYPYTVHDAKFWKSLQETQWQQCLDSLKACLGENGEKQDVPRDEWMQAFKIGCPIGYIRLARDEVEQKQGRGEWIGDLGLGRCRFEDVVDLAEREQSVQTNDARRVGDPNLVWFIDYLRPAFQGKQITTHVVKTFMQTFLLPVLGARDIRCSAYVGNWASRRVQEKAGFEYIENGGFETPVSESRGGGTARHWATRYRGGRLDEVEREIEELRRR